MKKAKFIDIYSLKNVSCWPQKHLKTLLSLSKKQYVVVVQVISDKSAACPKEQILQKKTLKLNFVCVSVPITTS